LGTHPLYPSSNFPASIKWAGHYHLFGRLCLRISLSFLPLVSFRIFLASQYSPSCVAYITVVSFRRNNPPRPNKLERMWSRVLRSKALNTSSKSTRSLSNATARARA
jgi:hypothetical protein